MTMSDLKNYKMQTLKPTYGTYRGYQIYSMPPSSSGGTHIIQLLNIMENFDVKAMKHNSPKFAHIWAEATKLAFADRSKYMADTAFVKVPLDGLQSKEYAKELAARIDSDKVGDKVEAGDPGNMIRDQIAHISRGLAQSVSLPAVSPLLTRTAISLLLQTPSTISAVQQSLCRSLAFSSMMRWMTFHRIRQALTRLNRANVLSSDEPDNCA